MLCMEIKKFSFNNTYGIPEELSYYFVVGHELENTGCDSAPELQACKNSAWGELVLVLVLPGWCCSCLLTVDGPQLSKHEGMEQGAHVEHGCLVKEEQKYQCCILLVQAAYGWTNPDWADLLLYLGLLWKTNEDYNKVVCNVRASIQRNGHTRRGTLMQSTVGKRA